MMSGVIPFADAPRGGLLSACFSFVCLSITRDPVNGVNTAEEREILNNLSPKPSPSDIALLSSITLHFIIDSKKLSQEEELLLYVCIYLFIYTCYAKILFILTFSFLADSLCNSQHCSVSLIFLPYFSAVQLRLEHPYQF